MIKTTRKQRESLKRIFYRTDYMPKNLHHYREFRKTVLRRFGGEAIMVPFAGMWLGIESDGYTHS